MNDFEQIIFKSAMSIVPMVLCLSVHEYAHARAAFALGDTTARDMNRMTLNPFSHIDWMGTIFLPIMLIASNLPFSFGWARPVPYNPNRFHSKIDKRTGAMLVAGAGPAANLCMAFSLIVILGLLQRFGLDSFVPKPFGMLFIQLIGINVALAVFNILPLPPLDGAKIIAGILPRSLADSYEAFFSQMGFFILFALIAFGSRIVSLPMAYVFNFLIHTVLPFFAGSASVSIG